MMKSPNVFGSIVLGRDMAKNTIQCKNLQTWRNFTLLMTDMNMRCSFASIFLLFFFLHIKILYSFTKMFHSGNEFNEVLKDRWEGQVEVIDVEESKNGLLMAKVKYKDGSEQWELVSNAMKAACSKC
jgi:hypothetical protein